MKEDIKIKIKKLYQQLEEEEKGRYAPGTGFRYVLPPNGLSYYAIASEIFEHARKLCSIDYKYSIYELAHTMTKEVECVKDYKLEYDRISNKPAQKSLDRLENLMQDATSHIYRDFVVYLD